MPSQVTLIPPHVQYQLDCKQAVEWFYSLPESERYLQWRDYAKKQEKLGKHFLTYEAWCVSFAALHDRWLQAGRPLL